MRSLGGFILLLAGIGLALFVCCRARRQHRTLAHRSVVACKAHPRLAAHLIFAFHRLDDTAHLVFAFHRLDDACAGRAPFASLETTAAPAPALQPAQAAIASDAQSGWQAVVAVATPSTTAASQPTTLGPRDPEARYNLVLDIQRQLRRIGCYWDRIDGSWGLVTKDAMKKFTDRVNATLPLDEPDYVQLALVQSHSDNVCGACPDGQSLSASGRCVGLPITPNRAGADEGGAPLEKQRGAWRPCRTAAIRADTDDGGLDRPAAGTHGDWRPDPDDGCRATEPAYHAGSRGRAAGNGDRRA